MTEAKARDLLAQPLAWPLRRRLERHAGYVARRFVLHDRLRRKERGVFQVHAFAPDRLSAWVEQRSAFEQTYARPVREARDSELDDRTADAIQNDRVPQFTLRNIGRYEWPTDPDEPLPWQPLPTVGGDPGQPLREVRNARLPRPEPVQVWSAAFMARSRAQLRRLVLEDPWEAKYGPEATSVHDGLGRTFVVEGTHPDDLPGVEFGPALIARPAVWQGPADGEPPMERPYDPVLQARALADNRDETDSRKFDL